MLSEDEEEDDDYHRDLVSSDIEQIQNLLEFKVKTGTHAYTKLQLSYTTVGLFAECFSSVSA